MKKLSILTIAFVFLFLSNCSETTSTEQEDYTGIIEGVDFDLLFAPPTESEMAEISQEWQSRQTSCSNITEVYSEDLFVNFKIYKLRVISEEIDGNIHYFAIILPGNADANSLPIMVYSHGGEQGVTISEVTSFSESNLTFGEIADNFALVIPSFRSEPLIVNDSLTFVSEGDQSTWNYDVDDALASIDAAIQITPQIDSTRIAVFGLSRGACVAMLMSIRDERIDLVIEFFGPTDFFGEFVKEICAKALEGIEYELPGFEYLNETYVQPLKNNEVGIDEFRIELLRRSPVYFIENMAPLQLHHGNNDEIVLVSQAERMIEVCNDAGFDENRFESYIYDDFGHDIFTVMAGMESALLFLQRFIIYS